MKRISVVSMIFLFTFILLTPSVFGVSKSTSPTITKIYGLNFSPYIKLGQNPDEGSLISESQLKETMKAVAPYTKWIRTYGCTGNLANAGLIAHQMGLKIAVGAWLSRDLLSNENEITNLIKIAKAGQADVLIVGSETLLRNDLTESQLVGYISRVKKAVPKIQVTTADTAKMFLQHQIIINSIDMVYANIYPYWDGMEIKEAVQSLNNQYGLLKKLAKNKQVVISETGWPSEGNTVGKAVPSVANEAYYFLNFISFAKATNTQYFYFEAFDENWKGNSLNPQEKHWGLWNNLMKMKTGINDVFKGKTVKNNWTVESKPILNVPDITLDKLANDRYLSSYGDASIMSKTTSNFTLKLPEDSATWGSVAVDVGSAIREKPINLSVYKYAIIRAKGAKGGEEFRFGLGGGPTDFYFSKGLTKNWQNIAIDLTFCSRNMKDITQIGFEIGSSWTKNKAGTTIYVDGIKFSNKLPNGPYLLSK